MPDDREISVRIAPEKAAPRPRRRALDEGQVFAILNAALVGATCGVWAEVRGPRDWIAGVFGAFAGAGCGYQVYRARLGLPLFLSTLFGAFMAIVGPTVDADIRTAVWGFLGSFPVISLTRYFFWTRPLASKSYPARSRASRFDEPSPPSLPERPIP